MTDRAQLAAPQLVRLAAKALRLKEQLNRHAKAAPAPVPASGPNTNSLLHMASARPMVAPESLWALERVAGVMHAELLDGVRRDEFSYEFQPIASCGTGVVVGYEALLRWRRDGQVVMPASFLPIAEEAGVIGGIQQRLLREAAAAVLAGTDSAFLALNWSPTQLADSDAVAAFIESIFEYGIDPTRLVIEITERTVSMDPPTAAANINRLKEVGVRMALDDFGKGYCGLAYLGRLPIEHLKIDAALVADLDRKPHATTIVKGVIDIAHRLGIEVVAEGVETERQRTLLMGLDCDYLQGYLIGRPAGLPLPGATATAARWSAPSRIRSRARRTPSSWWGSGPLHGSLRPFRIR